MSTPITGDYGGQCVDYVNEYLGTSVRGHAYQWYNNAKTTPCLVRTNAVAVWSGGRDGFGHVGVVVSWDEASRTMNFADSNRKGDETIIYNLGITEKQMKNYFGSSYKFEGYVRVTG